MSDFSWDRLPDELCLAVAGELEGRVHDSEGARALLAAKHAVPTLDLLRAGDRELAVAHALRDLWLRRDAVALRDLYAKAESRGLVDVSSRPPTERAMRSRLGRLALGRGLQEILLEVLLARGSTAGVSPGLQELPDFVSVPTGVGKAAPLLEHQREARRALSERFRRDGLGTRGLLVMPTGSGKTHTAVSWLLEDVVARRQKVLWVTHRRELMRQTAHAFIAAAPRLDPAVVPTFSIRLIGGGYSPGTVIPSDAHDVAIASVATLARNAARVRRWLEDHEVVVVFDEAHHSPAKSWRDVLRTARDVTNDAVIGLTATPTRMSEPEAVALAQLYGADSGRAQDAIIHEVRVDDLIEQQVLARPVPHVVRTEIELRDAAEQADVEHLKRFGELSERLRSQLAQSAPRNDLIVRTYLDGPSGGEASFGRTVVFAINRVHAELLAERFAAEGVEAATVHYEKGDEENRAGIERFRRGEVEVLINVEMLTEGVDVPNADSVFLARPTASLPLFSQMIGRGLRGPKVGGTVQAHIVDFADNWADFPNWRVPYLEDVAAAAELPESAPAATPLPGCYTLEQAVEMARQAYAASRASLLGHTALIPVGYLSFERELGEGDATADEVVLVFEHEWDGYEEIRRRVEANAFDELARIGDWRERFFGDLPSPAPAASVIDDLRAYVLETRSFPTFHTFAERDAVDPKRVARELASPDLTRAKERERVEAVIEGHAAIVERVWGAAVYRQEVSREITRILNGDPEPIEERRVPVISAGIREEWPFGGGHQDLDGLMHRTAADRDLFPHGLRPPTRISWGRAPARYWGLYQPGPEPRIVVNPLLDSPEVPEEVLSFLIYHELLHHDQYLQEGEAGIGHDSRLRRREAEHPAWIAADAFLDDFDRRFASAQPTDDRGSVQRGRAPS